MDSKDVDIRIPSGFSYHDNAKVRMQEISSGCLIREWIERVILNWFAFIPNNPRPRVRRYFRDALMTEIQSLVSHPQVARRRVAGSTL